MRNKLELNEYIMKYAKVQASLDNKSKEYAKLKSAQSSNMNKYNQMK